MNTMENPRILDHIVTDVTLPKQSVLSTIALFDDGATIPFIARYRKERTGGLDETQIRTIGEKLEYYRELERRRETILKTIGEQGKLTPDLEKEIVACRDKQKLEDLYLPYKPKRMTKATVAREKGLGPLAELILRQDVLSGSKEEIVNAHLNPEKGVATYEQALAGALDIVAETVSDSADVRGALREYFHQHGTLVAKVRKEWEGKKSKFEMYYEYSEPVKKMPSHRVLAVRRGAKEEFITWRIDVDPERSHELIAGQIVRDRASLFRAELLAAIKDGYERLLSSSIQIDVFCAKLEEAGREAISVFSKNARNLLLAPPAGHKLIMGVDPGFRTGCKVAVIDRNGNFREYLPVYPHEPQNRKDEAEKRLLELIGKYGIELICIGNGTASRETSVFINGMIRKHNLPVSALVVSEAGASVYSASPVAVREFPELDVTVRGAICIARRIQDPLAELVKIDPKSIGVGQYQHDVNQVELKKSLDLTVESCVNFVGVDLNTASAELLSYVSGIGRVLAGNIITYRSGKGSFRSKEELLEVPRFGRKAFEQCAGFLRIPGGENPLDNSAIHPERYQLVERMAADLGVSVPGLIGNEQRVAGIRLENYVSEDAGMPTLEDIVRELKKPGLDPREEFSGARFNADINGIGDLRADMVLDGTVTNVTNFGAFVDIGVHQDGLVHISRMSSRYVRDPHEILSVGDIVQVKVVSVDLELKRIALQMLGR